MEHILSKQEFSHLFYSRLSDEYGCEAKSATDEQVYGALSMTVRGILSDRHKKFMAHTYGQGAKQVCYLCMEFLMGRSLKNNLFNMGLTEYAAELLKEEGLSLEAAYEQEPDAGLGNGGLGRLAACYLDAMASGGYPGTGYSILYEYGIFRQKLVDGWQEELVDDWLPGGSVWLKSHPNQSIEVKFGGEVDERWDGAYHHVTLRGYEPVIAVPYDLYVSGYETGAVAKLRLFSAKAPGFDMKSFNKGDYYGALHRNSSAELISKVLYPNDNQMEGKILRLRQQYFLSAAAVGDLMRKHLDQYGSFDNLPDKVAIQLNDTHPTLAILELLRILLDDCGYAWEAAFSIAQRAFAYTNHTVMSEALEKWDEAVFRSNLPRLYSIVKEMDRRARADFFDAFPGDGGKVSYMAILGDGQVRMANLCAYVCHAINGVSKLHSEILKESVFHDYFLYKPVAFCNVTNGIAYRRWLLQANPRLTSFLQEAVGGDFKQDASHLSKLRAFSGDSAFLEKLLLIKRQNKEDFAAYLQKKAGTTLDPSSLFDVQVKRLHEYKRQHLNALSITADYLFLKENPNADFAPKTYLFGGKAAPGYYMAKQIIRYICALARLIEQDEAVRGKLHVVYLEDYSVTLSERLMPASEISEQISLAGTEASGTGNMKFMLSGAVTLGTRDGANIEIEQAAGKENFIPFGMNAGEAKARERGGYSPAELLAQGGEVRQVMDFMAEGFLGERFEELYSNLATLDPYMVLADFDDYRRGRREVERIVKDPALFARMSLANIAAAGVFSADRAVAEYARNIWNLRPVK